MNFLRRQSGDCVSVNEETKFLDFIKKDLHLCSENELKLNKIDDRFTIPLKFSLT